MVEEEKLRVNNTPTSERAISFQESLLTENKTWKKEK
jgi:hypothetical protein